MGMRAVLLLLAGVGTAGCLVTSQTDFQVEENVPPVVVDKAGTDAQIGSILWVNKAAFNSWSIVVDVRDENVDQHLVARWRVVTETERLPEFKHADLRGVKEKVRELEIKLDQGDLKEGECHRLDLVVSGSFFDRDLPSLFDVTMVPGDLGEATWWLWEGKGEALATDEQKLRINNSCDTLELAGAMATQSP